ncbi:MAG: hypothetical protein FJZ61_01605 [Chlamydiae bacterium]|nr:hypothetical protein [Chlamydiota bacterium]
MIRAIVLEKKWLTDLLVVFLLALSITFLGKISVPLPHTPIPMALRPQIVILLSWIFGYKRTAIALAAFVTSGCLDAHLLVSPKAFAMGVFGPTAGYILGYFVVAYLAEILRHKGLGITRSFLFMSLVIDVLGSLGMSLFFGFSKGFMLGFFPFLAGDFFKSIFFSAIARFLQKGPVDSGKCD